jgi:hypothetical protein
MRHVLAAAGVVIALSLPASAQWFTMKTPGIPCTADGKPDLTARAPKTADGAPDFSGIWLAGNPLPCPPFLRDGNECIEKIALSRPMANIGIDLPGGLPYQPWAAALAKQRAADLSKDDPHVRCLPSNIARFWTLPHYTKTIETRGQLAMLNEFNASYRQIFMDGRALPVDPQPSWNGYSSGRWDGDTLVVDTELLDEVCLENEKSLQHLVGK